MIVCGGRDFDDGARVFDALDRLHHQFPVSMVIEGGASGADRWARAWATLRRIEYRTFEADWRAHGRSAGPLRNRRMIEEGNPDGVVAFPGGVGTADMIAAAKQAGVPVWRPYREEAKP